MSKERESVQLQLYCRAAAPCRDYCGLTVTSECVILHIWNISRGPYVYPKRYKVELEEFVHDKHIQNDVCRLFGNHALTYVTDMSRKKKNLQYLPTKLFLRILKFLAAKDISQLSQTSKIFFELCSTNSVWEIIFKKKFSRANYSDSRLAEDRGWKEAFKYRLCSFINRDLKKNKSKSADVQNSQTKHNVIAEKKNSKGKSANSLSKSKSYTPTLLL